MQHTSLKKKISISYKTMASFPPKAICICVKTMQYIPDIHNHSLSVTLIF